MVEMKYSKDNNRQGPQKIILYWNFTGPIFQPNKSRRNMTGFCVNFSLFHISWTLMRTKVTDLFVNYKKFVGRSRFLSLTLPIYAYCACAKIIRALL